jgi:hypothetical protein
MRVAFAEWRGRALALLTGLRRARWMPYLAAAAIIMGAAWWLHRGAPNAAFAIDADTGVLTIEPLCGERLVWDLPHGRVLLRSPVPRAAEADDGRTGGVTLVLLPGSRARLESAEPGRLRIAVSHADEMHAACTQGAGPFYEVTVGDELLPPDSVGVSYGAMPGDPAADGPLALPLSGRVVLGDLVPLGAGWGPRPAGLLESAAVDLRVKPWLDSNRITLREERVERGGLLDTHACLAPRAAGDPCLTAATKPAIGFLRVRPEGGMDVQLYSTGALGAQSLGGDQYVIEIPRLTAAFQSSALKSVFSVLIAVIGLYQGCKAMLRDSVTFWKRKRTTAGLLLLLAAATPAIAQPVEVRQGASVGAGYAFRRGGSCLVVSARHVLPEMGVPVAVHDRTGARADGTRAYENEFYDLALVALPEKSPVACTAAWPDVSWLPRAAFSSRNEFRAVRHYTNGRETIVRLQHAGGVKHLLTLAPVDKLTIRESDSGTIVELDGQLVGIVQSVDPATDRVSVLRFDVIDQLVGDRFRGAASGPVSFVGVLSHGRANPLWSTYVQAWLTETAGRAVLPAAAGARRGAPTVCAVQVDVLAWERLSVPNPDYDAVALQLKACGRRGFIFEQTCAAGRRAAATTPRTVLSHKVTLNTTVTPPAGPPVTRLETTTHVPPSRRAAGRTEIDMMVLQAAAGPTLQELLNRAACP